MVVEQVSQRSEALKAGLQVDDVVFAWAQGLETGDIASTFDLDEVKLEYAPRGDLELRGRRGAEARTWKLHPGTWGIDARPFLPEEILAIYLEGRKLAGAGQWAAAAERWRGAVPLVGSSQPPWIVPWLLSEAGSALANAKRWDDADELERLAIAQTTDASPQVKAQLLESWAQSFYSRDWPQSRRLLLESLVERRKVKNESLYIAYVTNSLGFISRNEGSLNEAEEYYAQALTIGKRLAPESPAVALFLNNLGFIAYRRGALVQAEDCFRQALAIREKIAPGTSLPVLDNLGGIALDEGDFTKADEYWQRALVLAGPDSRSSLNVLNNLGRLAEVRKDLTAAEKYWRHESETIQKFDPDSLAFAASLARLARLALLRGDLDQAEDDQGRALRIREKLDAGGLAVAESFGDFGALAERRGDIDRAEDYRRRALEITGRLAPGSRAHVDSLFALARVARTKGELNEAVKLAISAIDMFENLAAKLDGPEEYRMEFRTQYSPYYRDCIDWLLALQQPEQAFAILERSRARSLLTMIAERDLVLAADLPADLKQARKLNDMAHDQVQDAVNQLNAGASTKRESLLARLTGLDAERNQIVERIRQLSPRLAALQYPQPLDLNGTRQALDKGTVLVSYSVGAERCAMFIVKPAGNDPGLSIIPIPIGEQSLQAQVERFRHLLVPGGVSAADVANSSRSLYDLLLKPAEQQLAGAERLLIVPDGPLDTLPFAALLRNEEQYLVEWKPLHTVASATVYSQLRRLRQSAFTHAIEFLAFGDPEARPGAKEKPQTLSRQLQAAQERGPTFGPLPFSREEIAGIAALYPKASQTYLGASATEERVKSLSPNARYIHFAVHAFLDERFPLNSALVLNIPENRTDGQDNGLLEAWEILEQIRLNADLVVLSACESALGAEIRGEGLIGLARAFQYAGARSILASLWRVDDRKTSELMTAFYQQLRGGKSKDEALRAAQLQLIHRTASRPYQWAAFSLIGDWQ